MNKLSNTNFYERNKTIFPNGVNSPLRDFNEVLTDPIVICEGNGVILKDIEGKEYTEFMSGLGAMILGHCNSQVIDAVQEQLKKGTIYSSMTPVEYELGLEIVNSSPHIDKIRFVCSGTEAVMAAIRVARAYTKKEKIIRFTGSYHGHADDVYYKGENQVLNWNEKGLTNSNASNTLTCEYNNIDSIEECFSNKNIAAVIIEPISSNSGVNLPNEEFLLKLRELCSKNRSLLIFDEVVTGFRFCYGSVSKLLNIEPDLITFGKIIGGGLPIGCFGGKESIMNTVEKIPGYFQGGTFASNPLTCVAGIETLKILKNGNIYKELDEKGQLFEKTLNELNNYEITRFGSLISFNEKSLKNKWKDVFANLHKSLVDNNILIPPSIDEPIFIMSDHKDEHIIKLCQSIKKFINDFKKSEIKNGL